MNQDPKAVALQFLQLAASGQVDEAYDNYVDMSGKHHNVYFPAGFPSLREAMKDAHKKSPNRLFTPKTVLADGDLVAVHSHLIRAGSAPEISVVHIFRIAKGKIVEMWDTGMELPSDSPNSDGEF